MNGYHLPLDLNEFQPALEYRLLQLLNQIEEPAPSDYTFHVEEENNALSGTINSHWFKCAYVSGILVIFLKRLKGGILLSHFHCAQISPV